MTTPRGRRAFALGLARSVALLCACAAPVHAAVRADFNGDGILDSIDIPQQPQTSIVVRLSGTAPALLPLADPIVSIAAVDLDRDGDLDLGALTRRRHLLIWLNRGHGRFAAIHRRAHPRRLTPTHTSTASDSSNADSSAQFTLNSPEELSSPSRWHASPAGQRRRVFRTPFSAASVDRVHPNQGRAPPLPRSGVLAAHNFH